MKHRALAALLAAAFLVCPPLPAPAQNSPSAQISALQLQSIADFLAADPEAATFLGDYSHDGDWSDPTPAGIAHMKRSLATYERKVDAIDMTGATLQDRDDVRLMRAFATAQLRQLGELEAGKDPSGPPLTVLGVVFTMILHMGEQDPAVWWDHMISRLEKAPAWMAAQRPLITHPGRLQAQVAVQELAMAPALFNYILTPMAAQLPADRKARFEKARDAVVA
ncbi:MAG: DUF885 family protein, partial [Candidatus Cybelea sp.]